MKRVEIVKTATMLSIINKTFSIAIDDLKDDAKKSVDQLTLELEVEKKVQGGKYHIEWLQSSTTDGKHVYISITAIISLKEDGNWLLKG